jgi:hypothetical protein
MDFITIKNMVPEWVPTNVRKKTKSDIEDSIGETMAEMGLGNPRDREIESLINSSVLTALDF